MYKLLIFAVIILITSGLLWYVYVYKKSNKLNKPIKPAKSTKAIKHAKVEKYEEIPPTNVSVLLCYANWCSHCPQVKEWYIDLVNSSPLSNVTFTMCEEQELPADVLNSIPGFPTILVFSNGQMQKYSGDRTKEDLLTYLKNI